MVIVVGLAAHASIHHPSSPPPTPTHPPAAQYLWPLLLPHRLHNSLSLTSTSSFQPPLHHTHPPHLLAIVRFIPLIPIQYPLDNNHPAPHFPLPPFISNSSNFAITSCLPISTSSAAVLPCAGYLLLRIITTCLPPQQPPLLMTRSRWSTRLRSPNGGFRRRAGPKKRPWL